MTEYCLTRQEREKAERFGGTDGDPRLFIRNNDLGYPDKGGHEKRGAANKARKKVGDPRAVE